MFESQDDGWSTCIYLEILLTPLIAIEIFRTEGINNSYRVSLALIVIPYYLTFLFNALFVLVPISMIEIYVSLYEVMLILICIHNVLVSS